MSGLGSVLDGIGGLFGKVEDEAATVKSPATATSSADWRDAPMVADVVPALRPEMQVHIVDLRDEPCILKRHQWAPHLHRDPRKFRGIVLHQWAAKVGTEGRLRQRYGGEAEALGQRGNHVPYTISAGAGQIHGEPVVSLAHPLERYTYSSDDACAEWISVGVMGLFPFEEDGRTVKHTVVTPVLLAAVDRALLEAVEMLREAQGDDAGPWSLITHRQGINGTGDHAECPGEAAVAMALASSVVREGLLVPDPDLVIVPRFGRAWPESWRRHIA